MENESAQSHEIRNLPAQPARVETGPLQFGDDWPGVFIRGDRAAALALDLGALIENARHFGTSPLETLALLGAYNVLRSCVVGPAREMFPDISFPGAPSAARIGNVPSRLIADLKMIADGELPGGDGVETPVSLWAKEWAAQLGAGPEMCHWREGPVGIWQGDCGYGIALPESTPEEHGMRFCHGCGKPVETIPRRRHRKGKGHASRSH